MGETVLYMDELERVYGKSFCRICHEAEFESCMPLESPCACSGTLQFAHRDCIQRWCDEKGNTTCEICLEEFEPGYTAPPPKKAAKLFDSGVTIRERREERDLESQRIFGTRGRQRIVSNSQCSRNVDQSAAFFKSVALVFTILLLLRHTLEVLIGGTEDYPFTLLTVVFIRASGIILPMYLLMRVVSAIHYSISHSYQDSDDETSDFEDEEEEESIRRTEHSVDIGSL